MSIYIPKKNKKKKKLCQQLIDILNYFFNFRYAITLWYFDQTEREDACRRFKNSWIEKLIAQIG